jgi:hypothetical protein
VAGGGGRGHGVCARACAIVTRWERQLLERGPALGRAQLGALEPAVARGYYAALNSLCSRPERGLLWLREMLGRCPPVVFVRARCSRSGAVPAWESL